MPSSFDRIDARIMRLVQENNRLTSDEIGDRIGLSATAVQRRLKKLRKNKTIEGDVSIISPKAVGRPVSMLVLVSLARDRADVIDRIKRALRQNADVMSAYCVTGEADFVLVVTATDMEGYERFTRRFLYEDPDIKGFKTLVVLDRVKVGFSLPIEAIDEIE